MFEPSSYQTAIFDFVENGTGNGIVNAVAGSGKTKVLVESAKLVKNDSALFIAFNKHIAEELSKRLDGTPMKSHTIHSLGFECLRERYGKLKVKNDKYLVFIDKSIEISFPHLRKHIFSIKRLVDLLRLNLSETDDGSIFATTLFYNLEFPEELFEDVCKVVRATLRHDLNLFTREIDFTDMLWLPHVHNLKPNMYDVVFADECQDFSPAQLSLILKLAPNGRYLFVGDPKQSVLGFAAADIESFSRIKTKTQAIEFPLSVCYRCPTKHLDMVRSIVPQIEAAPNAKEGIIGYVDNLNTVVPGDMILSRTTAPLIGACMSLISKKLSAKIRGADMSQQIITALRRIGEFDGFTYKNFYKYLDLYQAQRLETLKKRKFNGSAKRNLEDLIQTLEICYQSFKATSIEELCSQVESIFSDANADVWLSTVHRAKGLENERIFILNPDKMPLVWKDQQEHEYEQELNVRYVALTRSKNELYFVG